MTERAEESKEPGGLVVQCVLYRNVRPAATCHLEFWRGEIGIILRGRAAGRKGGPVPDSGEER